MHSFIPAGNDLTTYVTSLRIYCRKQIKDANAIGANAIIEVIEKDEKLLACVRANFCFVPPPPNTETACGCVHGKTHYRHIFRAPMKLMCMQISVMLILHNLLSC